MIVNEQLPVSAPGCSVNDADVTPALNVGLGVAELVSAATYGLAEGAGLGGGLAVHASAPLNVVATLPASVTPTVAGAGLFTSKATDAGETAGVGDGLGLAVGLAVGVGLAVALAVVL